VRRWVPKWKKDGLQRLLRMRGGIAVYCVVCDVGSIYITKIDDLHIRADDGRVKHARIEARGMRSGTRAVLDSSKREAHCAEPTRVG
jgi:hypothetical protein